ncbi:MAG: polyamine aminopropyltransferase [Candidatus Aminicenantes bacterium]|nr:polyamine aminopropyltransferase [Candidatus Aminicenantes bacterium]
MKKQSGKLICQPVCFPQRGKSTYSSAHSPPDGFLTRLPDIQRNCHGNKDAYIQVCVFYSLFFNCYNLAMVSEESYYSESLTDSFTRRFKINKLYFQGKTKNQFVECFYNQFLGKVLFLDKRIQSAQIDEYIYHESLVHPVLFSHPFPQKVLVLGGGEGATIREVLRHGTVEKVTMVDIDKELIDICQKYLPEWSEGAFSNPRTTLIFSDARQFIKETKNKFDVIISDLTEPVEKGLSVFLFTKEFFEKVFEVLKEDGLFVLQAGSTDPFYNQFFCSLVKTLEKVFPLVRPYWTFVLSFSMPWGFIIASKKEDPLKINEEEILKKIRSRKIEKLKFYHPGLHKGYFALPLYLIKSLKQGKVLTDKEPFIWQL